MNSSYRFLFGTLFFLILGSCVQLKHGNFDKQKFTHLKHYGQNRQNINSIAVSPENLIPSDAADTLIMNHCDTLYTAAGDTIICAILTETDQYIKFTNCPPTESSFRIYKDKLLDKKNASEVTTVQSNPSTSTVPNRVVLIKKERRNFNLLPEKEQNQSLIDFNRMFNSGLIMIIVASILLTLGVFGLMINIELVGAIFIAISCMLFFASWILSLVALNRVRKIKLDHAEKSLRWKVNLARFVAFLGIATCIITIFGGIILGILWAGKAL